MNASCMTAATIRGRQNTKQKVSSIQTDIPFLFTRKTSNNNPRRMHTACMLLNHLQSINNSSFHDHFTKQINCSYQILLVQLFWKHLKMYSCHAVEQKQFLRTQHCEVIRQNQIISFCRKRFEEPLFKIDEPLIVLGILMYLQSCLMP